MATTDPGTVIRETNEDNNKAAEVLALLAPIPRPIPRPEPEPAPRLTDLQVSRIVLSYERESRSLSATVTAVNSGEIGAGRHELRFIDLDDGIGLSPIVIADLAAGEQQSLARSVTLPENLNGRTLRLQAIIEPPGRSARATKTTTAARWKASRCRSSRLRPRALLRTR